MGVTDPEIIEITAGDRDVYLVNAGASYRAAYIAADTWADAPFEDEEIAALLSLDEEDRMAFTAGLIRLAEVIRENLRDLDGRILQLTTSQPDS